MSVIERDAVPGGAVLERLPILRLVPDDLRELVMASFQERSYAFGEQIVSEGEPADAFYVLTEGMARVLKTGPDGRELSVGLMRPGDSFGELGLMDDRPRTASIRACSPSAVARLDRSVFQALVRLYPEVAQAFRMQGRARLLGEFLRLSPMFAALEPDDIAMLVREAEEVHVAAGGQLIVEGDEAHSWWLIKDGRLTVYQARPARRDLRFLRTGDIFGELALYQAARRTASVEATSDAVLLEFPALTLSALLRNPGFRARIDERIAMYAQPARAPVDFPEAKPVAREPATSSTPLDKATPDPVADGVSLSEAPLDAPAWTAPRRFPLVRQIDAADCGAASVAMMCRAFGHPVSLTHVRHAVGTGERGTTLEGIQRGGEELGLSVRALKSSAERLKDLPMPAILHWESNHWVVVYRVGPDRVWLADPGRGLRTVPISEVRDKWSGYAATASPTPRLAETPRERLELRWLVPFLRGHERRLAAAIALALVAAGTAMLPPILSRDVIDAVLEHQGAGKVNALAALMLGLLMVSLVASLSQRRLLARSAVELDSDTLDFVTGRLLNLPLSYFQSRRTGDIERRLNGLRELRQLLVQGVPGALAGAVQLVVTLVIMFSYSWIIGVAFLATAPAYAVLMRLSATRLRPTFDNLEEAYARHASKQIDAIKGIEAVKTAGAEPGVRLRILEEFRHLAHKIFTGDFVLMSYEAAVQLTSFVIFVLFLWIAALLAIEGALSVGEVVAVDSLVLLASGPIALLLAFWDRGQIASVLLQRLQDVLDQEPEQDDAGRGLRPVHSLGGNLRLERVGLTYRDSPERAVLDEVSFELAPGMSLGLVGRSGSGKSSLLRCLAGLLLPTTGAIYYDGVDLRALRWSELRRRIGYVLQDPYLFDDTIAANIALGETDPDWDRIYRAAEIADAAEFVAELPLGYETRVGDSGIRLSGGQAQRVAIARALYHEPPLVLFDEATSALDTEAERAVQENLARVMADRTAVIVAHRLSTVRNADVIGVLERGRLVEWGSHEQLMARQGLYFHLNVVQVQS